MAGPASAPPTNAPPPAYTSLKVCASRGALEAVPVEPTRLDLARVRTAFEARGVAVLDCRVMLIAQLGREVTIGHDGRVLIKTSDATEAGELLARVREVLSLAAAP